MDVDDWTVVCLMSCHGALALVALFLCFYHHKGTALRVNAFFLLIATHGVVRCLFFGLSIHYSASRSARDFLDDIPGILFFSICCFFLYRAKLQGPLARSCMRYARLLGNFYCMAIANIFFYLLYFVLLYLAFTYQAERAGAQDSTSSTDGNVLIVETSISALFVVNYSLLIFGFGLLGLPFFCRLEPPNGGDYLEIVDKQRQYGSPPCSRKSSKPSSGQLSPAIPRQTSSTSLNISETDIGTAAKVDEHKRRGSRGERPVSVGSGFVDVRFSMDDDDDDDGGYLDDDNYEDESDISVDQVKEARLTIDEDDDLEEGHQKRRPASVTIEADRVITTSDSVLKSKLSLAVGGIGSGRGIAWPCGAMWTCARRPVLVACVWLIIVCFAARVVFLVLSLFFETPDQYNLHIEYSSEAREALDVLSRFFYYLLGEVFPTILLLVLHCNIITAMAFQQQQKRLSTESTITPPLREVSESAALLRSAGSTRALDALGQDSTIPQLERSELAMGEVVGCGSFGIVHRAQWRGLDVAVKKLYIATRMQDADSLNAFIQEITLVSKLRHPNVVQFLGYTPPPPDLMLITEFMPLGSLTDVLQHPVLQEQLDRNRRIRMARDIALGMNYLHGASILHCDLCPANCLVDGNLVVKIADFGLARLKSAGRSTTRGLGTPAYMAPEVLKNGPYTEASDVYSFAICFWQLLTGEEPYREVEGPFQIVFAVGNGERPSLARLTAGTPNGRRSKREDSERRLIERCWADDPRQRPSFADIVRWLNRLGREDDYWAANDDDDDDEEDEDSDDGGGQRAFGLYDSVEESLDRRPAWS